MMNTCSGIWKDFALPVMFEWIQALKVKVIIVLYETSPMANDTFYPYKYNIERKEGKQWKR